MKTNQYTPVPPQTFDYGKLPPQAIELEESLLGSILVDKDVMIIVRNILTTECFYKDAHQKIYAAIITLYDKKNPIDILTVSNELRKSNYLDEVGGIHYIARLSEMVVSTVNFEFHARIIKDKHILRELIKISSDITTKAYSNETDCSDLIDTSLLELSKLTDTSTIQVVRIATEINKTINELYEIANGNKKLLGVTSGLSNIDNKTSGWQNKDLIIIAARPSMGKTAIAIEFAKNANVPVLFFSLEMGSNQIALRCLSGDVECSQMELRRGNIPEAIIMEKSLSKFESIDFDICDKSGITINELRSISIQKKAKTGLGLIIVDYLQLMKSGQKKEVREQEISTISRGLKEIAKELDVPVIALSQLNRSVESRGGDKKPMLSDLRESGAIEQDADLVMFVHRPAYYGQTQDEDGNSTFGVCELIIAKHRNGACGTVKIAHNESLTKFKDNSNQLFESVKIVNINERIEPNKGFETTNEQAF